VQAPGLQLVFKESAGDSDAEVFHQQLLALDRRRYTAHPVRV